MTVPDQAATAWAYLVVSSEQQAETLDHQQTWATELSASRGWTLTKQFRGVSSGRDGTRGLLEELLEELRRTPRDKRPQRVLMIRLDRIGRGLGLEAIAAIAEIARLGVIMHTRQDGDYSLARASDSILPLMRVVTGAIENEARRDKAKAVYARRRATKTVVGNKRPYGLCVVDGKDVPQEPQAQAVRIAFELAVNGYGLAAIGGRLTSVAPEKTYVNGRKHRTEWTTNRVGQLLRNSAYRGTIVDENIWDNVQALRAGSGSERVKSKHPWPLSGAIHCTCGRILIGSIHGSIPRRVYRCSAKSVHGRILTFSALMLEAAFGDLLQRLTVMPELEAAYEMQSDLAMSVSSLELRSTQLDEELARQTAHRLRAWELNESGLIKDVELARRLKEIDTKIAAIERDHLLVARELRTIAVRAESVQRAAEIVSDAAVVWNAGEVERKRMAAQSLAKALGGFYVDGGSLHIGSPPKVDRFLRLPSTSGER